MSKNFNDQNLKLLNGFNSRFGRIEEVSELGERYVITAIV